MYTQDTIVAISTALGEGAIGLVRHRQPALSRKGPQPSG